MQLTMGPYNAVLMPLVINQESFETQNETLQTL